MAKKVQLPKELTRKQQSRAEREARQRRYLLIGVGVVVAIVIGLLLAGVYNEQVLKPNQAVAKVNNTPITAQAFQKRVRYQQFNLLSHLSQLERQRVQYENDPNSSFMVSYIDQQKAQIQSLLTNPDLLGKNVLDAMIDEELTRQEAARRNIAVSAAEVTQFIEQDSFGFYRIPPTPAPTSTPLPTPSVPLTVTPAPTLTPVPSPTPISEADFNTAYKNYLTTLAEQAGMNEADFRRMVENELLRRKVQQAFVDEAPATADHIKLRYVQLESDPAVQIASSFLEGGGSFDKFYVDVGSGQIISATNGETGWMLVDNILQQFDEPVANTLLGLTISQTTGVITNVYGNAYVFQLVGRENRPLDDSQRTSKGQQAFEDWLARQRQDPAVVDYLNDRYVDLVPALKLAY